MVLKKADSNRAGALKKEIDEVMDFLGIDAVFISDETKFWDFRLSDQDMEELQEEFGVIADKKMNLVDFALQIKKIGLT